MNTDMLRDRDARARISRDFDLNMLVEAGAGSGKTHSLAERMAAGIAAGAYVIDRMAAVTFTRKAAAELRGRFQVALETRLRGASGDEEARLRQALAHIERFFAGTIHAFCAQLLRERPVEAGVAPGFSELDEVQDLNRRRQSWRDYVTQAKSSGLPSMLAVLDAGLTPRDLDQAFDLVCMYEEVEFASTPAPAPDATASWAAIDTFSADLRAILPPALEPDTTCGVQQRARTFLAQLGVADRPRPSAAVDLLKTWDFKARVVQYRWPSKVQSARALTLVEQFQSATVRPFLSAWRAHVYSLAVTVLSDARRFAADDRRRANTLSYNDLLIGAATLLRTQPAVRRALQQKYRWLFVDEFQDTDPVQAEVMAWLAATDEAPASADADWTSVRLRPGALFVVGDPKQSIYRFRRADIDVYNQVRALVTASGGATLPLTSSFRSAPALCEWANRVFPTLFPRETTPYAPAFTPLDAVRPVPADPGGVATLTVAADVERARVADEEAARIARIIRAEVDAGRRGFGDFLVLTRKKRVLARYARALEALDIPLEVSGAGAFAESEAVAALALLLRALSDPDDAVTLVGVLRGPFFGISDPALFAFRQTGGWFSLLATPQTSVETGDAVHRPNRETAAGRPPASTDGRDASDHRNASAGRGDALRRPSAAQLDLFADGAEADRLDTAEGRKPTPEADVEGALGSLRAMYRWTRRLPVGAAIERILEDTGFLAMAVCTPGGAEAGDLLHAVDRIRQVAEGGGTLADAADSLDEDIDATTEVESIPLEPGRPDVVRVMNLHKVKGLEAPVVFLADPCGGMASIADVCVQRQGGRGIGAFPITRAPEDKPWSKTLMGKRADWDVLAAEEVKYLDAEQDRLLYVAATRARDRLIVGRWPGKPPGQMTRAWDKFDRFLEGVPEVEIPDLPLVSARPQPALQPERARGDRRQRHESARRPSWRVASVTEEHHLAGPAPRIRAAADEGASLAGSLDRSVLAAAASGEGIGAIDEDPARALLQETASHRADAGVAWGSLIHGLLEQAMRQDASADGGVEDTAREDLRRLAQWLTLDTPDLRPWIPQAIATVEAVMRADFWRDARRAPACLVEVPFALGGPESVQHGVIDLVYQTATGWRVIDYKTDRVSTGADLWRLYGPQVRTYASAWQSLVAGDRVEAGLFSVRLLELAME